MKRSYSTEPNTDTNYSQLAVNALSMLSLASFKSMADQNALQFDITVKTDGVRINVIKKNPDKTVRKRSIECDNADLASLQFKLQQAIQEILMMSYSPF